MPPKTESIDDIKIPVSVKCAVSVIFSIAVGTWVVSARAGEIRTQTEQAKHAAQSAEDAAVKSTEKIKQVSDALKDLDKTHDKRITVLEQAILQAEKDRNERKKTEEQIRADLQKIQVKISNMEGISSAQTDAILKVLERLEKKVDK